MFTGSPIVHQVFNGRKLVANKRNLAQKKDAKTASLQLNTQSMYTSSQMASNMGQPGVDQQPSNRTARRKQVVSDSLTSREALKPSAHVGVLKVPASLKAQHLMESDPLESVATGKSRKGAGKSLIIHLIISHSYDTPKY